MGNEMISTFKVSLGFEEMVESLAFFIKMRFKSLSTAKQVHIFYNRMDFVISPWFRGTSA